MLKKKNLFLPFFSFCLPSLKFIHESPQILLELIAAGRSTNCFCPTFILYSILFAACLAEQWFMALEESSL